MSDERKYSEFVESMHRLYNGGMIQDKLLDNLFAGHKISKDEYLYIIRKEVLYVYLFDQ